MLGPALSGRSPWLLSGPSGPLWPSGVNQRRKCLSVCPPPVTDFSSIFFFKERAVAGKSGRTHCLMCQGGSQLFPTQILTRVPWEAVDDGPMPGPWVPTDSPGGTPGSRPWPGPVLAVAGLWGVTSGWTSAVPPCRLLCLSRT